MGGRSWEGGAAQLSASLVGGVSAGTRRGWVADGGRPGAVAPARTAVSASSAVIRARTGYRAELQRGGRSFTRSKAARFG